MIQPGKNTCLIKNNVKSPLLFLLSLGVPQVGLILLIMATPSCGFKVSSSQIPRRAFAGIRTHDPSGWESDILTIRPQRSICLSIGVWFWRATRRRESNSHQLQKGFMGGVGGISDDRCLLEWGLFKNKSTGTLMLSMPHVMGSDTPSPPPGDNMEYKDQFPLQRMYVARPGQG
jgi:hypothetical protein